MIRAAFLCLLLAGCASAPQVIEKPVEVQIPVPVPCKVPDTPAPAWPLASVPVSASDFDFFKAALAEIELRKGYEARLLAALGACH
jgi:hypothetical protein